MEIMVLFCTKISNITSSDRVSKFESYKTCEQIEENYKFPFDALTYFIKFLECYVIYSL